MGKLLTLLLLVLSFLYFSCGKGDKQTTDDSKKENSKELRVTVSKADFFKAVKDNEPAKVKDYLEKDKNLVKAIDSSSGINETALGISTFGGYKEITEMLVKNGADVNYQDAFGIAPMHGAARTNRTEIIQVLIENKANVNLATPDGKETPLHYAAKYNNPDVVKLLLEKGADKTAKDSQGMTPYDAAKKDNADKVLDLLK